VSDRSARLMAELCQTAEFGHVRVESQPVAADPVEPLTPVEAEEDADLDRAGSGPDHGTCVSVV